jgi:hypothetical protein
MSGGLTTPMRLVPPLRERLVDDQGIVSDAWSAWFVALGDRPQAGNSGFARTGSVVSDGSAVITGTFDPPFQTAPIISLYDAAGVLVAITGIVASAVGFTATAPIATTAYTWVAIG